MSNSVIEDWTIEFDYPYNINRFYTAEILSHDDNHYIVKNAGYNANIKLGQTLMLGFNGSSVKVSEEIKNVEMKYAETKLDDLYKDSDGDGIDDYTEVMLGLNPLLVDTDGNGILDGDEDLDGDGLTILQELEYGTNNLLEDTDGDGLSDYDEIFIFGTNPLVADTDGDTISDGHEILLGLDPTNPKTFGVPDAEYKVLQSITSESDKFSEINTEDSPYKLSLDIDASGYVEEELIVRETRYAKTISNDSIIGIAPELLYKDSDNVGNVTLKFEVSDEQIDNQLHLFPEEELEGIKRFNIFKYFEELNMLLPIETKFDHENNIVYAEVDELGTYCIIDMELWINSFGVLENEEVLDEAPRAFSIDNVIIKNNEEKSRVESSEILNYKEDKDKASSGNKKNNEDSSLYNLSTASVKSEKTNNSDVHTPIDIVFIFQTEGVSENYYNLQKQMLNNVAEKLYDTYTDVRICVIQYKENEASIVGTETYPVWQKGKSYVNTVLNEITYDISNANCNRGTAFSLMLNEIVFRENAGKFVFQIMNGASFVGDGYFSQLDACEKRNINYSEIILSGWQYVDPDYRQMVENAIARTNGINLIFDENTDENVYNHIEYNIAPPQVGFDVIVPTGWKNIVLNGILDSNNGIDTDNDGLTDWEEVDTKRIEWDTDGKLILPTVQDCIEYVDKPYAEKGLERFIEEQYTPGVPPYEIGRYMRHILNNVNVLPIISDPTEIDSDDDDLNDIDDPNPLIGNCGGKNFENHNNHILEVGKDGYYHCGLCSYRIKLPQIQDNSILDTHDLNIVKALYIMYTYYLGLRCEERGYDSIPCKNELLILNEIARIRNQDKYNGLYDFSNKSGKCVQKTYDVTGCVYLTTKTIDKFQLGWYNGTYQSAIGLLIPALIPDLGVITTLIGVGADEELSIVSGAELLLVAIGKKYNVNILETSLGLYSLYDDIESNEVEIGDYEYNICLDRGGYGGLKRQSYVTFVFNQVGNPIYSSYVEYGYGDKLEFEGQYR